MTRRLPKLGTCDAKPRTTTLKLVREPCMPKGFAYPICEKEKMKKQTVQRFNSFSLSLWCFLIVEAT